MRLLAASILAVLILGYAVDTHWSRAKVHRFSAEVQRTQRSPHDSTEDAGSPPPPTDHFEKVVLDSFTTRPNELDVAEDGRVFYIEREGAVKVWHPKTRKTEMVGFIPVKAIHTNGLMGMTLDPAFADNGWMYLYYAPRGNDTENLLTRYTIRDNRIIPSSRKVILHAPTDRHVGGGPHSGGSLTFGPDGNLFLATGDRTNPTEVELSTPIDERPAREHWDAQRTAGNTMSLQGKILRIKPNSDGTYDIPTGNLFPFGAVGRPEIFVMGNRNPYRITVDPANGWLYWGDYGPSAAEKEKRGAAGFDEFNQAREAGFYGWPYFVGDNRPFRNYDFAADTSGRYYDPRGPVNDSPNNTGARLLPPAQPAMIWYPAGPSKEFPEMGAGGRGPMGGAVYRYDERTVGTHGLPEYYDGKLFIMEFMRWWIKEVSFDENGDLAEIRPFLPEMTFRRPFDMELGPDGSIYLIEWGENYEGWFNDRGKIVRLKYHGRRDRPPVATMTADRTSGGAPLQVEFSAVEGHARSEAQVQKYSWDFDGDGDADAAGRNPTYTFEEPGRYVTTLTVTDDRGLKDTASVEITSGNAAPDVTIDWPLEGGIVDLDEKFPYMASVTDQEDKNIDEEDIVVRPYLAHDSHWHRLAETFGSEGQVSVPSHTRHFFLEDEYARLSVTYTDRSVRQTASLTSAEYRSLQPRQKDAVHTTSIHGAERVTEGSLRLRDSVKTYLDVADGDWVSYAPVNLRNIEAIKFRVLPDAGGLVELHLDDPTGPLLGTVDVRPAKGGKPAWNEVTVPVDDPGGPHELFLHFTGPSTKEKDLMRIDWFEFDGAGMMELPN